MNIKVIAEWLVGLCQGREVKHLSNEGLAEMEKLAQLLKDDYGIVAAPSLMEAEITRELCREMPAVFTPAKRKYYVPRKDENKKFSSKPKKRPRR